MAERLVETPIDPSVEPTIIDGDDKKVERDVCSYFVFSGFL